MARFKGAVKNCTQCGAEFRVSPSRAATATTCSNKCGDVQRGLSRRRRVTLNCQECGVEYRVPRCHAERRVFCSKTCMEASPEIMALKADKRGEKNPMWKGGYPSARKDRYLSVRAPGHPFASGGNILEHRLVMERWLIENEPNSPFLILLGGRPYLSPEYEVHHKDLTRTNNAIENLQCLTPGDHARLHNKIARDAMAYYRIHVINATKH